MTSSDILTSIREGLVEADKRAWENEPSVTCDNCMSGESIDKYHRQIFTENAISTGYYGGDFVPNWFPFNAVPNTKDR